MKDEDKTKDQLIDELWQARQQIDWLRGTEASHRRSEDLLRISEEKYRIMVEKSNQAITVVQDGRFKYLNLTAPEILGHPREVLLERPIAGFFHPSDRNTFIKRQAKRMKGENIGDIDSMRVIDHEGHVRWMEIKAVPIEWEEKRAFLMCITNRSEQHRAEEALRESETRYRILFEHADDAIFFETENNEIVDANYTACELFGYSRKELLAMKTSDLYPTAEPFQSIYSNPALAHDTAMEIVGRRRDGADLAIEYTITPLISGRKTIFMSIVRDCTERKKAEEERLQYEKLQAILEMTGAVCHELNQPMMATFGYVELLLLKTPKDDPLHDKVIKIKEQIDRMGGITNKLMQITKYVTRDYLEGRKIIDIDKAVGG
ncbi:MAG: PAS domain S-box protein [Desulfobacterales bacterium]|nr:PAS domain S-box protein [Desulfobacterales bacterium]